MITSKYLDTAFGKLHYRELDRNADHTILLLHGNASSAISFDAMSQLLPEHYNIIALDFPGHGLSSHVDIDEHGDVYGILGLRDVLIDFAQRLGLSGCTVVGNSLGANIAVQALPYFDFAGVVLMASIHAENREGFFNTILPAAPKDLALKNELTSDEVKIVANAFIHESKRQAPCYDQMVQDIQASDGAFRDQLVHNMKTQEWPNELALLQETNVPLLYIGGADDAFISPSYYMQLQNHVGAERLPVQLIDDVSHVPHLEAVAQSADAIHKFIQTY